MHLPSYLDSECCSGGIMKLIFFQLMSEQIRWQGNVKESEFSFVWFRSVGVTSDQFCNSTKYNCIITVLLHGAMVVFLLTAL